MSALLKQQLLIEKESLISKLVAVCNLLDNLLKDEPTGHSVPSLPIPTEKYILEVLEFFLSEKPRQVYQVISELYNRGYACYPYRVRSVLKAHPERFKSLGPRMGWVKTNHE